MVFYLVRKVAIENLSCGLWLAIRETQTVETGNYFDHRQCTVYVQCTLYIYFYMLVMKEEKVWQNMAEFDCLVFGQFDL